jgi:hypothetical protein
MASTRRLGTLLSLVLMITLTGACTPDEPAATATSSPTMSSSPSPTATPTPTTSPEDEAAARADEVVRAWLRAQTDCLVDPAAVEVTCFDGVAVGTELNDLRNALIGAQGLGNTVSGEMTAVSLDVRQVDLAMDLAVSPPIVPTVVFGACLDVSNYNIVDKDGQSIVPVDRPAHVSSAISVYNYDYPDEAGWRVGLSIADGEAPSCAD